MDIKEIIDRCCPWGQRYSGAAYAADGVIKPEDFASTDVRRLFRGRSGFALSTPGHLDVRYGEDAQLIGALLSKLSQRGVPAPCSLKVERHVLNRAYEFDILDFVETGEREIQFSCRNALRDLNLMIAACLIPELLLSDEDTGALLDCYRSLCTPPEQDFFDRLCTFLPDRRLALLVLPQRQMGSMLRTRDHHTIDDADRVDFAIEIPYLQEDRHLRIAIEIDDSKTHDIEAQKKQDRVRDNALSSNRWKVYRFPLKEMDDWEPRIRMITELMNEAIPDKLIRAAEKLREFPLERRRAVQGLVLLPVAEAQITAAVGDLIHQGRLTSDIAIGDPQNLGLDVVVEAVADTLDIFARLHNIEILDWPRLAKDDAREPDLLYYGIPSSAAWDSIRDSNSVVIAPAPSLSDNVGQLLSAKPRPIEVSSKMREEVIQKGTEYLLQNVFRKVRFLPGQAKIIQRALTMEPVVGLLPTAAGKSLCYQLCSFIQPGFTLIIDPLRSLMSDQESSLQDMGIHRCIAIMSGGKVSPMAAYDSVKNGSQTFVFVAPERLQIPNFREFMSVLTHCVPYCVIDESHCVSEWGHDFRTSYLNVGRRVREYCVDKDTRPSLLALTGTASRNVIVNIMQELEIDDQEAVIEADSFDRTELDFEFYRVRARDRVAEIARRLELALTHFGWRSGDPGSIPSGLIFTNFAKGSLGVRILANELRKRLGLPENTIEIYAGYLPDAEKAETQQRFKDGKVRILVCTQGFGMGIDKKDIRFTIHSMLPRSLEEFYQQAGRAGRDGRPARCILIFSDDKPDLADEILDTSRTSFEEISHKKDRASNYNDRDDAIHNTYFLTSNFLGKDQEKKILQYVIGRLMDLCLGRQPELLPSDSPPALNFWELPMISNEDLSEQHLEKALYRLLSIGAIKDYKKDYTGRRFLVEMSGLGTQNIYESLEKYLRRYGIQEDKDSPSFFPQERKEEYRDAAYDCGCCLINYVYEKIEKRRRQAMREMLDTARTAEDEGGEKFRELLLTYLEESEFTEPVQQLVTHIEPKEWYEILEKVQGADDITKLLGACRRQLTEFPDHPGLWLLSGLCRSTSPDPQQGIEDVKRSLNMLNSQDRIYVAKEIMESVKRLLDSTRFDTILCAILEIDPTREMARVCYEKAARYSRAQLLALHILVSGIHDLIQAKDK